MGATSSWLVTRAMRLGFNYPMGPLELNDYNGLDVGLNNALSLRDALYGLFRASVEGVAPEARHLGLEQHLLVLQVHGSA